MAERRARERQAAARVRETGERVTAARVSVLAALLGARAPLSHAELERRVAHARMDRVTLYRVLEWLVARGLARRIAAADRAWRFVAAGGGHEAHAHFHCRGCGKVLCLERAKTARVAAPVPPGFRADGIEVTVRGLCRGCR
ncbi:MAG: transcriptional repressor [Burkholderiales bacterium]|nr:transcriptional repressor [Burkholderiales bacterium]